jgi:tetratricopeptide (TPR) repeat protein
LKRSLWLCAALLAPTLSLADDSQPPLNPLTAKAITEFQAGQKDAACVDATAALSADAADKNALGISKLTCGEKPIDKLDFKKKPQKGAEEEKDNLKPKPFSGNANGAPGQQPSSAPQAQANSGRESGGLPAENTPSQVISDPSGGPGIMDQPTTYDKLMESQSLLSQGKPAEAAEAARRAVELQPGNRRAFDAWAEAARQLRGYDQVLAISERGLQSFPNDLDLLRSKVFALNKKGDYKAALAAADQALALYATDATLLALKAYALGRSGDHDGMVKALETAFALDPSFEQLLLDARGSKDGEPFLMPGDSKEAPRSRPGAGSAPWPGRSSSQGSSRCCSSSSCLRSPACTSAASPNRRPRRRLPDELLPRRDTGIGPRPRRIPAHLEFRPSGARALALQMGLSGLGVRRGSALGHAGRGLRLFLEGLAETAPGRVLRD